MSLKKIALATAIIGIISLIFLSQAIEPKEIEIGKINSKMVGEYVKVSGQISGIKHSKITSFTMKDDSGDISVFSYENLNLTRGEYEVLGKVNEYHGVLEIEISKMARVG